MDLNQLRYFSMVASEASIVNAAKKLYISQAALSRSISNLEAELQVQLFDRSSNRIYLNKTGQAFLQHVNRAFLELEDGVKIIRQQNDPETGTLVIAFSSNGLATVSLKEFILAHPRIHAMQYIESPDQMQEQVQLRNIDLCITRTHFEDPAIQWNPLLRDEMLLFVHKDNPLAGRKYVNMQELSNQRFLLNGYGMETTDWFYDICRQAGFTPDILYAGSDTDILDLFLQENLGIYPTPALMYCYKDLTEENENGFMDAISVLRIRGVDATRLLGMATLKNRSYTPTVDTFISYVEARFQTLREAVRRTFHIQQP